MVLLLLLAHKNSILIKYKQVVITDLSTEYLSHFIRFFWVHTMKAVWFSEEDIFLKSTNLLYSLQVVAFLSMVSGSCDAFFLLTWFG